ARPHPTPTAGAWRGARPCSAPARSGMPLWSCARRRRAAVDARPALQASGPPPAAKRQRLAADLAPSAAEPAASVSPSLLEACEGFDVTVALHLEAACLARLASASRADRDRFSGSFVKWCADRRRSELSSRQVRGDLALAATAEGAQDGARWTLERLHLAEHPPRFPRLYFEFASSEMVPGMEGRVAQAVGILQRFPGLRVRIEGYGAPSAPPALGRALSQARAVAMPGSGERTCVKQWRSDGGQYS
ncbi:unnamed protein product, partial [Prorocentrum cordatum]